MTRVAVECPVCARCFVVNGRGRCRCGADLVVLSALRYGYRFVVTDDAWIQDETGAWSHGLAREEPPDATP